MMLRRFAPAPLLALAMFACTPSVPSQQTTVVVAAEFDLSPTATVIPLPNDLVLQPQLNPGILNPQSAQDELLAYFFAQGGFPADQVTPVTFPITKQSVNGPNDIGHSPPAIAPTALVPCTGPRTPANCNVLVIQTLPTLAFPALSASYDPGAPGAEAGTLSVVPVSGTGPTPWTSDRQAVTHYVYALRGGANGIKTTAGEPLQPSSTMYTLLFGGPSDFVCPPTSPDCPLPLLGLIHASYQPIFAAIEGYGFPLAETAVVGSFPVAPATTWVAADAATGQVPFPSDFLIDPTTGRITSALDAQLPGLSSLDGFSTTAMILAPTSGPIQAETVRDPTLANPAGVYLYKLGAGGTTATKVPDVIDALTASPAGSVRPVYAAEPPQIQSGGLAQVIGLQPAVPADAGVAQFALPPLEENTEYAVVVTDRVKDAAGAALSKTTLGQIELFTHALCSPSPACVSNPTAAKSELPGVPGVQAAGLEAMRLGLKPVIAQLAADTGCNDSPAAATCLTKANVQMAYTFRTQTISGKNATAAAGGKGAAGAIQIAAIPYTPLLPGVCAALATRLNLPNLDCTKPIPGTMKTWSGSTAGTTVADGFTAWGIDLGVPHDKIDTIYEVQIATVNKISNATGAFDPSPTGAQPEILTVLVAVGAQARMPACTGPLAGLATAGFRCAPMVVFQHGITTAKNLMLGAANTLVDAGNIVVALDLPWHGQRTFCSTTSVAGDPNAACLPGDHCVLEPSMTGQALPGTSSPGRCRTGPNPTDPLAPFLNQSALCLNPGTPGTPGASCAVVSGLPSPVGLDPATGAANNSGYPFSSGEFFISANFFRTRDAMRQAWIDHTQLLQVLAPTPVAGPVAGNDFYNALLAKGIVVNPFDTSLLGQSLGSIASTGSVAANPRFSKAVLNTNGGTAVDTFTNSPRYQAQVDALFLTLGIDRDLIRNPPAPGSPDYPQYLAEASAYLTYLNVLKLVIDGADPINAAPHVQGDPWPNLITPLGGNPDGSVAQAPKQVLAQYAICDQSVPNPFNALVAGDIGLTPFLPPQAPGTGTVQWYGSMGITYPAFPPIYPTACTPGAPHGFLLSWGAEYAAGTPGRDAVQSLTAAALNSAASFLADPSQPLPSLVVVP